MTQSKMSFSQSERLFEKTKVKKEPSSEKVQILLRHLQNIKNCVKTVKKCEEHLQRCQNFLEENVDENFDSVDNSSVTLGGLLSISLDILIEIYEKIHTFKKSNGASISRLVHIDFAVNITTMHSGLRFGQIQATLAIYGITSCRVPTHINQLIQMLEDLIVF